MVTRTSTRVGTKLGVDAFLRVSALSQEYGIYIPGTTACMVVIFMLGTCRVDGPRACSAIDPLYYSIVFGSLIC